MISRRHTRRGAPWLGLSALAAALLLGGCGGSDDAPDPLESYRTQTLQWGPCDTTILGVPEERTREIWQELGERLQCANMRAPMDWSRPERSDIQVSVMRVTSAAPAQRRGVLMFNPGGPGGDGLNNALDLFMAFGKSNPDSEQGALQLRLLDSYDMVGFSPRGTGASTRLHCATNELRRFVDPAPTALTEANQLAQHYNARKSAEACLRNPLTPYVNSDATARDMDLLRALLGEEKLNYVGYSYGTWLGGWYASLFPQRVGRMVLDSSQDFTGTHEEATVVMPAARQRVHDQVMLPYGARHAAYFQLGDTPAGIDAMLHSLSPRIQGLLSMGLGGLTYGRSQVEEYLFVLNAARGLDAALAAVPDQSDEDAVEAALLRQVFIAGDSERDKTVRELAAKLYEGYHKRYLKFEPEGIEVKTTYWAVSCNDSHSSTDVRAWDDLVRDLARQAPLFYSGLAENPCLYWGGPRVTKPDVAAMHKAGVLMVQSQYDAATPLEGANRFFAQLPAARRVYVPGESAHGVFPYSDSCVDPVVVRYLLGEAPAERETVCPALPLELDQEAGAAATQAAPGRATAPVGRQAERNAAPPAPQDAASETYKDPRKAQELIDRFKEGIRRGGR